MIDIIKSKSVNAGYDGVSTPVGFFYNPEPDVFIFNKDKSKMIDMKDIVTVVCDECGEPMGAKEGFTYNIMDREEQFCSYSCAEQFVNNYNVDEAERKAER